MDADDTDPPFQSLRPANFAVLVGILVCIVAVPAAFWMADVGLLPWAQELRWDQLRARTSFAAPARDSDSVELARSGCFGSCPVYTVKLFASGRVEFDGEAYVCAPGRQFADIEPQRARELIADIAAAGFFDLTWDAGPEIADAPSATLTLKVGGHTRSTPGLYADSSSPRLFQKIGREIDAVTDTAQWLPVHAGYLLLCENGHDLNGARQAG